MYESEQFKMPEDLGERCAQAMLDEIFTGGVIDSTNQSLLLLLAGVSSGDNISQIKLGRVTQQSIHLLRHLKQFFNLQFKIQECEDDVYSEESEEEDQNQEDSEMTEQ